MSETYTISEERYDTAYIYGMVTQSCGVLMLAGSSVALSIGMLEPNLDPGYMASGLLLGILGTIAITAALSIFERGLWYRVWGNNSWVLDDVDRCELAEKGVVEVTVDD